MDLKVYEQIAIAAELVGFAANFLVETTEVQVTMCEGNAIGIQLAPRMDFEVIETIDDAARGDTATSATKSPTLETRFSVQVPLFIKTRDRIRISTEDGSYVERV